MPLQATFIADFSKWDAELKKAQVGLKTFEVAGKSAGKELERMSKSLSGVDIKKQADIAVAAVKAVGGATALTAAEQKKVNATVTEAIAKYHALGQQAPAEMLKLAKATEQVAKPTEQASISVTKLAASYVAGMVTWEAAKRVLGGIVDFLASSVQSYAAAEKATAKLTQALKNTGNASKQTLDDMSNLATEFQRTTRFSDDLVTEVQALFTQLGDVGPKDMKAALQAAADLSEGLGIDLEQAATAVSKALQGNETSLRKLAPSMDEAALKGGNLADIAAEINKHFGGQAAAQLDTYAGRVAQLANDWDNVKEAIGRAIVEDPLVKQVLRGTTDAIGGMEGATKSLTISQAAQTAALSQGNYGLAAFIKTLRIAADESNTLAENAAFVSRSIDTMSQKASKVSLKGLFPEITAEGLAEWDRQNESIDKATEAAKKAAEAFKVLRDRLTGATLIASLRELDRVWKSLTPAQRSVALSTGTVVKEYQNLAAQLPALPKDLRTFSIEMNTAAENSGRMALSLGELKPIIESLGPTLDKTGRAFYDFGLDIGFEQRLPLIPFYKTLGETISRLPDSIKPVTDETEKWRDSLDNVSQAFAELAQVADGSLSDIFAFMGRVVGSANLMVKSVDGIKAGMKGISAAKGLGEMVGGIAQLTTGLLGAAAAAIELGTALYDAFTKSRAEETAERIGREFGVAVSEEFAKTIEEQTKKFFGNRQAAQIFNLDRIISEGGGLSAENVRPLFARFRDLFVMLETGAFSSAQAIEVLDKNFRTFADFVTKGGSLASKELLDIIKLTEETGLKSAEVSAFVVQETSKALGGLTTFLQNAQVKTQAAADGIGAALFGIFNAQTANGVPAADIIKQLDPLIQKLDEQLKAAGLSGGAAFTAIKDLASVASHEIAGPLITGILGLGDALEGLHNAGVLTEDMFDGLTASVADTYAQILATGVDGAKALQLIAPSLQDIWELQEDFGHTVDEATQKLLDEAAAAGLVGEKHRTAQEQMLNATNRMADGIDRLVGLFEDLAGATDDFGDAINNLPEIPSPRDIPSFDGGSGGDAGNYERYYAARGGMVPKYLAGGGPSGSDTVPAWLTPGEFVMRREAVNRIGAGALSAMNSGAGGGMTVNVTIQGWDGTDIMRVVRNGEFKNAIVKELDSNEGQFGARVAAKVQKYGVR